MSLNEKYIKVIIFLLSIVGGNLTNAISSFEYKDAILWVRKIRYKTSRRAEMASYRDQ